MNDGVHTDEWCRQSTTAAAVSIQAHSAPLGLAFFDADSTVTLEYHTYIHTFICKYICMCVHAACGYAYPNTYIHTCINTYIRTCIHKNIHTYIHTYTGVDMADFLRRWTEMHSSHCTARGTETRPLDSKYVVYVCCCLYVRA